MKPFPPIMVIATLALGACGDSTTPGPAPVPTQLAFTVQPADDTAGATLPQVRVAARDAQGTLASGFTGSVTVALAANPGGAVLSGTLTVDAVAGVATFSDLSVSKAEDGYTLTATSGTLSAATSAAFDVSEVVTSVTLRYETESLDLETAAILDCGIGCLYPTGHDLHLAYNGTVPPPARVFHNESTAQIAHLTSRTFASVHLADTAGAGFTDNLIDESFDGTRTILIRTAAGNVYKLGDPVDAPPNSLRFNFARLN